MTNPLNMIKEIERRLTLARLQRSNLAAMIYAATASNREACEILLAQLQKVIDEDATVDKLLEYLYDSLAEQHRAN